MNKTEDLLGQLIEQFWFVPSDALLRAVEAEVWSRQSFTHPVLDIGCGDGSVSKFIYSQQGRLEVGIDTDCRAVKQAEISGVYGKAICANATKMPFKNESFKTVVSNSTFEHIRNDVAPIAEVARVLEPGGRFFFTVPSNRFPKMLSQLGLKKEELRRLNKRINHFHYRSPKEWGVILSRFGLRLTHFEYYFPKELVKVWYRLFKLATFKPYHRELWSYLRDSPLGKIVPERPVIFLLKAYLRKYYARAFLRKGSWLFMIAEKQK